MYANALQIHDDVMVELDTVPAPQTATHLHLAVSAIDLAWEDEQAGPDLGAFEEQYLLGYACFA